MIMESVGGICDRLMPYSASEAAQAGVPLSVIDEAVGFIHGDDATLTQGSGPTNDGLRDDNIGDATSWP